MNIDQEYKQDDEELHGVQFPEMMYVTPLAPVGTNEGASDSLRSVDRLAKRVSKPSRKLKIKPLDSDFSLFDLARVSDDYSKLQKSES